jgi:hypothetical protein
MRMPVTSGADFLRRYAMKPTDSGELRRTCAALFGRASRVTVLAARTGRAPGLANAWVTRPVDAVRQPLHVLGGSPGGARG